MTLYFRVWTIKSHSPGYEIGPINRSVLNVALATFRFSLCGRIYTTILVDSTR